MSSSAAERAATTICTFRLALALEPIVGRRFVGTKRANLSAGDVRLVSDIGYPEMWFASTIAIAIRPAVAVLPAQKPNRGPMQFAEAEDHGGRFPLG